MKYLEKRKSILKLIVIPIVSSLIIPLAVTDIWIEIYHHICFPIYKIPLIKRSRYIKIDRHKLKYLNELALTYPYF